MPGLICESGSLLGRAARGRGNVHLGSELLILLVLDLISHY